MRGRRRGIARLVEALLAVSLVVIAIVTSYALAPTQNPKTVRREAADDSMAYDLLARLAQGNPLASQFYLTTSSSPQLYLNATGIGLLVVSLNAIVPANTAFNLSIFEVQLNGTSSLATFSPMVTSTNGSAVIPITTPITNSPNSQFVSNAGYVSLGVYMLSLPNGRIVLFELQLAPLTAL